MLYTGQRQERMADFTAIISARIRLSQRCSWGLHPCGMRRRVTARLVPDVTRERGGIIFKDHIPEERRTHILISSYHEIVNGRQRKLQCGIYIFAVLWNLTPCGYVGMYGHFRVNCFPPIVYLKDGVPPKHWYISTKPHGTTSNRTVFVTLIWTWIQKTAFRWRKTHCEVQTSEYLSGAFNL